MAVKASATITLFDIVDIDSITIYYLLQSSTANPPAKPTTDNPGGNWVTTEPTYVEGSTQTLYTVTKTKYSDGTFEYTPVSKSSSYEAAKTAYNKAVAAQNTASAAYTVIISSTQPADTTKIWFNTNTSLFYEYDSDLSDWVKINDVTNTLSDIRTAISNARLYAETLTGEINDDLSQHYYTIEETNNYVQSSNNQTLETYNRIIATSTQNGNTAYDKVLALEAFIKRGQDEETGKPFIELGTGDINGYSLRIENDTIVICKAGIPVSTWESDKFDVATVITKSLGIGNFDFVVNTDGSVSFRKVRDD